MSTIGIVCFMINPHSDDGWIPKTEAGTHIVSVHSKLIEAEVLVPQDTTSCSYLIPSLETAKQSVRGTTFANIMSKRGENNAFPEQLQTIATQRVRWFAQLTILFFDQH